MKPTTAALWVVAGMAVFGLSDNLVPLLAGEMSVWQVLALRSALALPLALAWAGRRGMQAVVALIGRSPWRLAVRSALGCSALCLYFAAMPSVGMGLAAAGMFTSPICILVISALFMGERIGPRRIVAVMLGTAGMAMVLGIGAVPIAPIAVLPLTAGLFYALMVIWTREQCRTEASLSLAVWQLLMFMAFGFVGTLASPWIAGLFEGDEGADFLYHPWAQVHPWHWGVLMAIGITALLGSVILATGYRSGPASIVGLFDYSFLVWGPFFAWLLRDEALGPRALAGIGLIAAAGLLAAWAGRDRARPPSPARLR